MKMIHIGDLVRGYAAAARPPVLITQINALTDRAHTSVGKGTTHLYQPARPH